MGKLYWDEKDPNDVLDYTVSWADRLGVDTISASTWIGVPSGITLTLSANTTTQASVWISGGTSNYIYDLTNRITTASGRIMDQTVRLEVWDK